MCIRVADAGTHSARKALAETVTAARTKDRMIASAARPGYVQL